MYPILFEYKIFNIGTYGVLLGLAFYLSFLVIERELILRGTKADEDQNAELAYRLLLTVIPTAIIGAKLFHIIDNWSDFMADPTGMILSGAGLSVYGGFVLAIPACIWVIRKSGRDIFSVLDASAPAMAIGYAVGRLGCHVSGDGCYGIATQTIFGTAYPNGFVPSSMAVFPTPLFESLFSFMVFIALLKLRKSAALPAGALFFIYLILNGIPRYLIEFVRTNPPLVPGFTQAQIVAVFFFLTGVIGLILIIRKHRAEAGG